MRTRTYGYTHMHGMACDAYIQTRIRTHMGGKRDGCAPVITAIT